jgi:ATP-dependent DNA helicase PIF1
MKEEEMKIWIDIIDKDNNYEKSIQITENAQVMLLKNIDQDNGLVNGSRGIVIGFENDLPIVRFMNGMTQTIGYAEYSYEISNVSTIVAKQIPLSLAWCTTIHKSQGQSLDSIKMNIGSNIFEYGQTYVALSRARTLEYLYIEEFDPKKIRVHPKVKELF